MFSKSNILSQYLQYQDVYFKGTYIITKTRFIKTWPVNSQVCYFLIISLMCKNHTVGFVNEEKAPLRVLAPSYKIAL